MAADRYKGGGHGERDAIGAAANVRWRIHQRIYTVVTAEDRYNTRDAFKVGDAIGAGQIDTNGQEQ
jgi:hypothetical protein